MEKRAYTVQESLVEMQSIAMEHLKNTAHREFVKDTLMAAKASEGVMSALTAQVTALEAAYEEELDTSVIEDTVQRLTQEINQLAAVRSEGQTTLKSGLRAVWGAPGDEEKAALARQLFELMHRYDLHTGMNVDEQTAVIDSFIRDIEENYPDAMQAVGVEALYIQLKNQNEAVCQRVYDRDDAKVGLGTGRMEAARTATDRAWRNLRNGANFLASTDDAPYAHFIGHMNELIIRYKRVHLGETVESPEADGEGGEGGGPSNVPTTPPAPTWPEIDPDSEREFTATFLDSETMDEIEIVRGRYGTPLTPPQAPEGTIWPRNLPATMPYGDFVTRNIPADSPTEPLYKLEYKDGDEVLRTDMLPVNSIIIRYPLPDDKMWTHFPHRGLTPAQDWTVVAGEE